MAGLDTDELSDLENSSTDAGTDFSGNIDASYEKPALDKAAAESQASESDAETEPSGSAPNSTFNYKNDNKKKKGKKKKKIALLVGSGGGFLLLAVLVIFMANMLKIPNLAQHIAQYNMFSAARTFNKSAQQSLAERLAPSVANEVDDDIIRQTMRSKVGEGWSTFRGKTWGKLDKYRPQKVIENLGAEGKLKYKYEVIERSKLSPFPGNKLSLKAIEIDGIEVDLPNTKFGRIFSNSAEKIRFSSELDVAVAAAQPEMGFIVRSRVVSNLRNALGVKFNFWQKGGAAYKNLKRDQGFKQQQIESLDRTSTTPNNANCATTSLCDEVPEATKNLKKAISSDEVKPETNLAKTLTEDTPDSPIISTATSEAVDSALVVNFGLNAIRFVGGIYEVALPLCIIYDGSIVKAQPVIDAKDAALQKTYYGLMTAADQQKSGQTNAVAVGAMNDKLGNISQSLPEQRAYGRKVSTKDYVTEPEQPQNGGLAEDISIATMLPSVLAKPTEQILKLCPILLDPKTSVALAALMIAPSWGAIKEAVISGVGKISAKFIAEEVGTVIVKDVVEEAAKKSLKRRIWAKTWPLLLKTGGAIVGANLAKLFVLSRMGGTTNGLETGSSYANRADMGGNLVGNDIHRQALMGRPLDEVEQIASRAEDQKDLAMITSRESAWNRYLAIGNVHSLISKMGFGMLNTFGGNNVARFSAIRNIFSFGFIRNSWGFIQNMTPGRGIVLAATNQTDNYGIVQWGWTKEELDISETDPSYGVIINDEIYNSRSDKQDIEDKYSKCFTESMGSLLAGDSITKKEGQVEINDKLCSPTNLGIKNPTYGDGVFRYRLSVKNNNVLDHLLDVQNVGAAP